MGRHSFTSTTPERKLMNDGSSGSVLDMVKNAFSMDNSDHNSPVNLMDSSMARYSNSESAPMGEGQLMGNHARRTNDVENGGGMEDIWLDGSGGRGGKGRYRNPHDGTKRRQRCFFWTLMVITGALVGGVVWMRQGSSDNATPAALATTQAPKTATAEAPMAQAGTEEEAPPLFQDPEHEQAVEEFDEDGGDDEGDSIDVVAGEDLVAGEDEGDAPVDDDGDADADDTGDDEEEEEEEETISEAIEDINGQIEDIQAEEEDVQEAIDEAEDEEEAAALQEEESVLEDMEEAANEEIEVLTELDEADTDTEADLLAAEYGVLEEQLDNMEDTAELLDEEAADIENGEDTADVENQIEQLEDEEGQLEDQQEAIDTEEIQELDEEIADEDGQ